MFYFYLSDITQEYFTALDSHDDLSTGTQTCIHFHINQHAVVLL